MSVLRALRGRIQAIKSIQKISAAMKMVASSKLQQAQRKSDAAKPYGIELEALLQRLLHASGERIWQSPNFPILLQGNPQSAVHQIIVLSSQKGLCGAFNGNLIKETNRLVKNLGGTPFTLLCIGRKGRELLKPLYATASQQGASSITFAEQLEDLLHHKDSKREVANNLAQMILSELQRGGIGQVTLLHNTFRSILSQEVCLKKLIPFTPLEVSQESLQEDKREEQTDYLLEPSLEAILEEIALRRLQSHLYQSLWDSELSEHALRMRTMDQATRNARDVVSRLETLYNRTRQAQITRELIEIVAGADALKIAE